MSDAAKEAFKAGFLTRCAEEGLTGEALAARLARVAEFNEKTASFAADAAKATSRGLSQRYGLLNELMDQAGALQRRGNLRLLPNTPRAANYSGNFGRGVTAQHLSGLANKAMQGLYATHDALEALPTKLAKTAGIVGDIATAAGGVAAVPLVGSLLAGGALGYGAAKLTAPKLDEDEMKSQELINTYKVMAARARSRRKLREYRLAR